MAIALASKPGISGATTLSIPATWDAAWFRNFIANQLKGADVRNANGINGIVVSGNIASPFATISFNLPASGITTTSPAAGGAGALPATPLGYVTVIIGGSPHKVAFY